MLPLALAIIVACSWLSPFDSLAGEKIDAGLKRALISFATARTLNAVISVIQGTDVAIQPAGVGVKFAPGQILDPINDLVEKFSNLMLAASVSFGIMHILIGIGGHWFMSLALTSATLLWSFFYLRRTLIPAWMTNLLVITVILRFAIPTVTVGTDLLFQHFLADEYSTSQTLIESSTSTVQKIAPPPSLSETPSVWEKMKSLAPPDMNISKQIDRLVQAAEQWPEHMIRLMVVFLLETLIIPLILLWLLVSLTKSLVTVQFPRRPFERSEPSFSNSIR